MNDAETGTRTRKKYRDKNLYIVIGDEFCTISMQDNEYSQRTMAGLDLVANLVTRLLRHGDQMEDIAEFCCKSASRGKGDIPGILNEVINETSKAK